MKNNQAKSIAFGISFTLSFVPVANYGADCRNFQSTKEKLAASLRGYQCEIAGSMEECGEKLGLGTYGLAAIAAGAGGAIGKKISDRIRNPSFVICPLKHQALIEQPFRTKAPSSVVLQKILRGLESMFPSDTAHASCLAEEKVLKMRLESTLLSHVNLLRETIEKQKAEKGLGSAVDIKQYEENRKNLLANHEDTKFLIDGMNDKLLKTANQGLESGTLENRPVLRDKSNALMAKVREGELSKNDGLIAMKNLLQEGVSSGELTSQEALAMDRSLRTRLVEITKLGGLKQHAANLEAELLEPDKAHELALAQSTEPSAEFKVEKAKNLASLTSQKLEFEIILSELQNKTTMNTNDLLGVTEKIYDAKVLTPALDRQLFHITSSIQHVERQQALTSARAGMAAGMMTGAERLERYNKQVGAAIKPALNLKRMVGKSIIGIITSAGFVSVAGAAEKEEMAENFLDSVDASGVVLHVANTGDGKCGEMTSSVLIDRDPENGCWFKTDFNDKIYSTLLNADDSTLKELFQDQGVCEFLTKNYEKYYPEALNKDVDCSQIPVKVQFADQTAVAVSARQMEFSDKKVDGRLIFDLDTSNAKPYMVINGRTRTPANEKTLSDKFSDHYELASRMRAATMEIAACCRLDSNEGAMPSANECRHYGIRLPSSSSGFDSGNGNGNQ